jgi:TolB protein
MNTVRPVGGVLVIAILGMAAAVANGGARPAATDRSIVFAGVRWSKDGTSETMQIYAVRPDGSGQRRLTPIANREDSDPAWSRDGRRIAFGRGDMRARRLAVMNADGTRARTITGPLALAGAPSWSPDGRRIAFAWMPLHPPGPTFAQQVEIVGPDGRGLHALTRYARFKGGAGTPAWSPDGSRILFAGATTSTGKWAIWSVRPDGRALRMLIPRATEPAWSPDGRRIAFVRDFDVYTATAGGARVRRLTRHDGESGAPVWSPDGAQIAFVRTKRQKDPSRDDARIAIMNADGSGRREITDRSPLFWASAPSWR